MSESECPMPEQHGRLCRENLYQYSPIPVFMTYHDQYVIVTTLNRNKYDITGARRELASPGQHNHETYVFYVGDKTVDEACAGRGIDDLARDLRFYITHEGLMEQHEMVVGAVRADMIDLSEGAGA